LEDRKWRLLLRVFRLLGDESEKEEEDRVGSQGGKIGRNLQIECRKNVKGGKNR
jgi:hypothetical protein